MVRVIPLLTVNGPVTFAFSVARIVMFVSRACELVRNMPPFLKLPLNSDVGVTVQAAKSRKYTNILPVPLDGAAENVSVEPSGTVYAALS